MSIRCTSMVRGTHLRSPLHQNSEIKGSSSNEMILKVSEINWSERTFEKTSRHLHCL